MGKFAKGNQAAKGHSHPYARRSLKLKGEVLKATKPEHIRKVVEVLYSQAMSGNIPAIKEYLDRVLGRCEIIEVPNDSEQDTIKLILDPQFAKMMGIENFTTPDGEKVSLHPDPEPLAGTFGEQEIPLDGD
jgi:hypothetical protein